MPTLEFTLDAADLSRLRRWPGLRAGRAAPLELVWHDTPDAALAGQAMTLERRAGLWTLRALQPPLPATSAVLAQDRALAALDAGMPEGVGPVARLAGRRQTLSAVPDVALHLVSGTADGGAAPVCRLGIEGPGAKVQALCLALAAELRLGVPRLTLAAEALAAAGALVPAPRALGAPQVAGGQPVTHSLALIIGHLLDVMLHWAQHVPAGRTPEPVHQMRVATRRLRSALSVFKRVAPCPEWAAIAEPLRTCAARLGAARDWDVFLGGLGARLAAAFPDDRRCAALLRAATQRRAAAYEALGRYLASPEFRVLTVALACAAALRPWEEGPDETPDETEIDPLMEDTAVFAAATLARRMRQVRRAGKGIEALSIPALHELRKDCKRLRYAAEFFAPLFPARKARRFLSRLAALQEELGLLNDGAAVSGLMAQLGRLERGYAAGLVEGFSAAHAGPARTRIVAQWRKFKAVPSFW